jgi:hydroxyethylthiazole kinase-like uncharacterized protein yjeF
MVSSLLRPVTAYLAASSAAFLLPSRHQCRRRRWPRRVVSIIVLGTAGSITTVASSAQSSSSSVDQHYTTSCSNQLGMATMKLSSNDIDTGYLNASDAAALDEDLMTVPGFTLEQLMELAGLSVAEAVYQMLQNQQSNPESLANNNTSPQRILIVCGPGNNGGDGLVAARHLCMFGYETMVVYPTKTAAAIKHPHYINLVQQCEDLGITVTETMPDNWSTHYTIIVDAIFGFSFRGAPRPPFAAILQQLKSVQGDDAVTIVSVDVPSGWDVNGATTDRNDPLVPDALVSLTAPKRCAQTFYGRHFVGGRFLPPNLAKKYNIRMPNYPGVAQVVEITRPDKPPRK